MSGLPEAGDPTAFERIARDDPRLAAAAGDLARRHGQDAPRIERFADGSLPVYAVGNDAVLKLYPPCYSFEEPIETSVLRALDGRLSIPTPRVLAAGSHDGWRYLLMTRLCGTSLAQAWPRIPPALRERRMEELGATLATLHALPTEGIAVPRPHWASFLRERAEATIARQRTAGLDERWLEQIPDYLAREMPPAEARPVLLHTEVMREHILVRDADQDFAFSGLIDFEPAMVGAAEYEFASVGIFVTCGEPDLLPRLLRAYGYETHAIGPALARRFLAYALLHKYANLAWYLRRLAPPDDVRTLEALAERWWGG